MLYFLHAELTFPRPSTASHVGCSVGGAATHNDLTPANTSGAHSYRVLSLGRGGWGMIHQVLQRPRAVF